MALAGAPEYDVIIVGGGVAGLSAALVLGRARRRVAVVDAGAPRNAAAEHVHGYLTRDGTAPAELLRLARAEVRAYGVELVDGTVDAVSRRQVELDDGRTLEGRHIILAMGLQDMLPDIGGARERWGKDFLQCPYCHGWEVANRKLGVLGTSSSSVQQALLVRQFSSAVNLFLHEIEDLAEESAESLRKCGVDIVEGKVRTLVAEEDALVRVELEDGRHVDCEALFFEPGSTVDASVAGSLQCRTGTNGCIITDEDGRTGIAGIWAVGNAADPAAQLICAAADAYRLAISLNAELIEEDAVRS